MKRDNLEWFNRQWLRPVSATDGVDSSYKFEVTKYGGDMALRDCHKQMTWDFWCEDKKGARAHVKAMRKFRDDLNKFIEVYHEAHLE